MRCVDVNILVYAHRLESPEHAEYRVWLEEALKGSEPLGLSDVVASGFLRIVTHPRIFREPTPLDVAIQFIDAVRVSPATISVNPGERHCEIFSNLCRRVEANGNRIPDTFLAALAIEQGATWVTADRGFARYPDLRWVHPLER
ncbi:MAG: type II toxin-antitoxin system VapC family toxin [Acidimicrobiales bacterium]